MQMNLPNKLTTMRVILIPVFLLVLFLMDEPMNRYIATAIFIVASLTDFLDGHIARKYNLVSNFGKFMDPLADKLLVMSALVSMVAMEDLPAWVVIVILAREFAITGFRTLAMEANIVMAASWWGKIKTTTQMIMIILVLLHLPFAAMPMIENILVGLAVFFTIVSGADYIIKNKTGSGKDNLWKNQNGNGGEYQAILDICAPYIEHTNVTFEYVVPQKRICRAKVRFWEKYPYLVYEEDGVIGGMYAHQFMVRAASQWGAELSVYLAPAFQKKGLGKAFYRALMDILRLQNVEKVYGCIEATNRASYVLHTSLGFVETAVFPRCGFKHGKWLGLMWLEKPMVERREPLPFQRVRDVDEKKITEILETRSKEVHIGQK